MAPPTDARQVSDLPKATSLSFESGLRPLAQDKNVIGKSKLAAHRNG
jgi:hypothetical protein